LLRARRGEGRGDARGRVVCKQVLEDFCGHLLVLPKLLNIFGAAYLGKGSDCLNADEWLFIADTLK
jgi:hypothetical protein